MTVGRPLGAPAATRGTGHVSKSRMLINKFKLRPTAVDFEPCPSPLPPFHNSSLQLPLSV
jgi:hypothetical protein